MAADLSNRPAVIGASGFSNRVELRVLRPDTLANAAALTYEVSMAGLLKDARLGAVPCCPCCNLPSWDAPPTFFDVPSCRSSSTVPLAWP